MSRVKKITPSPTETKHETFYLGKVEVIQVVAVSGVAERSRPDGAASVGSSIRYYSLDGKLLAER